MWSCQESLVVERHQKDKGKYSGSQTVLYLKGFGSKWIQTATVWIEILFWRHKSSVRCDILHTMLLVHTTSCTHLLNLRSDKASPSPPVGGMQSISETLPLHYGREDLVQNNAQHTQSKGSICMLPLCWWAWWSTLMHVCVCWAKLFCVKFSPGSIGNTSGGSAQVPLHTNLFIGHLASMEAIEPRQLGASWCFIILSPADRQHGRRYIHCRTLM